MTPFSILTYHVWCRTEEVAPDQHLVTVCAVPVPQAEGADSTSESRLFISCELAETEGERMTDAMTQRLSAAGHRVERVTVLKSGEE